MGIRPTFNSTSQGPYSNSAHSLELYPTHKWLWLHKATSLEDHDNHYQWNAWNTSFLNSTNMAKILLALDATTPIVMVVPLQEEGEILPQFARKNKIPQV